MGELLVGAKLVAPTVFTCKRCRSIISDSTQIICSIGRLGLLAMRGVSAVDLELNSQRYDAFTAGDSECCALRCQGCKGVVGRMFKSVPQGLHAVKGAFSLDVASIDSYQLGVCEMQVEDCAAPVLQRNLDIPGADSVAAAQCAHLTDRLERLESDVLKVQNLLLLHNERLEAMELGMPSSLPSAMHGPIPPSAPCTRPQTGMEGLLLTAAACQPARRPAAASAPAEGVAAPKQLRHPQPLHSQVAAGVAASSQPSSELEAAAGCTSAGQDLDDAPPALVKKYKRKRADESARPQAGVDGAKRAR